MTDEFIVPTGHIIKEYLDELEISPKQCSQILGVTEKYLLELLNGKINLTQDLALKFEEVIKHIPASYWINYENKYQQYKIKEEASLNILDPDYLKSISKKFKFNSVFNGLGWSLNKQANEMLKILKISSFEQFDSIYSNLSVNFMEDGGELESIAIWLNLAEEEIELQNGDLTSKDYNKQKLIDSLEKFKMLALNNDYENSIKSVRKLLNRLGIYLVFESAIENSKVRGALTTYKEKPAIFLSGRFKTHDHIWFALMHEVGHLIKHYVPNKPIITLESDLLIPDDTDVKEEEANEFARDFFIDKASYTKFISTQKFSKENIYTFAKSQNALP